LLTDRDEISSFHRGHFIDASYQISVNLAKWFQRRRFLKVGHILIFFLAHLAKGNVGFWHHLASVVCCLSSVNFSHFNLLLWNPSDASYHVSVHLAKRFRRRRFLKIGHSETRIAFGRPCLVMDHNKMCTL
jgi:hypothetical protein